MNLILASASPRRAEILRNAGFSFHVLPAHADETLLQGETADDYVRRLAETKAQTVAASCPAEADSIVIGADTVVYSEGRILGKPGDPAEARRMLRQLSGRTHQVLTGVALVRTRDSARSAAVETTQVTFLQLTTPEIDAYIASGEPFDKAGGYGVQGIAGRFVSRVEGCYFNVMGLPVSRLWQMLAALGWCDDGGGRKNM